MLAAWVRLLRWEAKTQANARQRKAPKPKPNQRPGAHVRNRRAGKDWIWEQAAQQPAVRESCRETLVPAPGQRTQAHPVIANQHWLARGACLTLPSKKVGERAFHRGAICAGAIQTKVRALRILGLNDPAVPRDLVRAIQNRATAGLDALDSRVDAIDHDVVIPEWVRRLGGFVIMPPTGTSPSLNIRYLPIGPMSKPSPSVQPKSLV